MNSHSYSALGTLSKTMQKQLNPDSPFISSKIAQTPKPTFLQRICLPQIINSKNPSLSGSWKNEYYDVQEAKSQIVIQVPKAKK